MLHARYTRGALAYYSGHRMRLVDVIGTNVAQWELRSRDLQSTAGTGLDPRGYVTTMVEGGAGSSEVEASDEAGFVAELVTDNFDNDGINMQLVGEAYRLVSTRDIYFGLALQVNDATQSDFWVGLAITATDALGGVTDSVRFQKVDGATGVGVFTEKDSTETTTASVYTMANDVTVALEFYWDGSGITFFVDGAQVARHTGANVPDDEALSPCIQWLAGAAAAKRMKIAWARAYSIG